VGEEFIAFPIEEEHYNFDNGVNYNNAQIDECLIYYDWLADSVTTSHITHQQDVFTTYTPVDSRSVTGLGGTATKITGCGTVELISMCNSEEHVLHLEHVLHVPGTRNNLISRGRWDAAGGCYQGRQG
jgi:hypothetical protein